MSIRYDAQGTKLSLSSTVSGATTVRDYVAGVYQYLTPAGGSRALAEIAHEEGRYTPASGYEYYLKDHLGNVRVTLGQSGVTQWADYDPWGWELPALTSGASTNRQKFNGQESIPEIGPGMLDFGARLYDATIGRWGVVDPLAEISRRWSPFVFGYDNPLRFVDPDGMAGRDALGNVTFNGFAGIGEGGYVTGNVENSKQGQQEETSNKDQNASANSLTNSDLNVKGNETISESSPPVPVPKKGQSQNTTGKNTKQGPQRQNWILRMLRESSLFPGVGMIGGEAAIVKAGTELFNFTETAATHMDEVGRMIPIQTLDDVIKAPLSVVKDPQGTNALMHYSQMWKNGRLYNVEVLYDKITNTILHFKYTQKPLGTLPATK